MAAHYWTLILAAGRRGAVLRKVFGTNNADPWPRALQVASRLVNADGPAMAAPDEELVIRLERQAPEQ